MKQDNSHPTNLKSSVDLSMFTPEEIRQAEQLVPHIDIHDYALVFSYGDEAQKKLSTSSDRILRQVKSKISSYLLPSKITLFYEDYVYDFMYRTYKNW